MAPGCSTITNDHTQIISQYSEAQSITSSSKIQTNKQNQIPLPSSPPPPTIAPIVIKKSPSFRTLETVDSFEILEQTIMKQKRLGKTKNSDLRMKILLKRTFNLVCEMMDQENGNSSNNSASEIDTDTQEKESDFQETLIINLNESECLDSQFQIDDTELNYIDLENFNYGQLLENENSIMTSNSDYNNDSSILSKNESFLGEVFPIKSDSGRNNKRRRSSADEEFGFAEDFENKDRSYYLFNDLTNSSSSNKIRCLRNGESFEISNNENIKKFQKESLNIVT